MKYANDTELVRSGGNYGGYVRGSALCADGIVRTLHFPGGGHADTFFSVPAYVYAKGKRVDGFAMVATAEGLSEPTDDDPLVVTFTAYTYRKNHVLVKKPKPKRVRKPKQPVPA